MDEQQYTYRYQHVARDGRVTWTSDDSWTTSARVMRQGVLAGRLTGSGEARLAIDEQGVVLYGLDADGRPWRRLQWGIQPPDGPDTIVACAWSARAIYDGRTVDVLHDRQDVCGAPGDRAALVRWLDERALPHLRDLAAGRDLPGTRDQHEVRVRGDGYVLVADPRRSSGYLYLGAWADPSATEPLPRLAALHVSAAGRRCTVCRALPGYRHETTCRRAYAAPRRARGEVRP